MAQEKLFENKIKKMLKNRNAYFVKFFANSYTRVGVPDILACVNGFFVAIEVKAQNGHVSELQLFNIEQIRKAGGFAFVVYPTGYEQLVEIIDGLQREVYTRCMPMILK